MSNNKYMTPLVDSAPKGVRHSFQSLMLSEMLCRVASILGKSAGEDSQGRAKIDKATPKEVVDHCVEIVELAMAAMEERGWIEPPCDMTTYTELAEAFARIKDPGFLTEEKLAAVRETLIRLEGR